MKGKVRGRKDKEKGRGVEAEEGIWPTEKFWRGTPYDLRRRKTKTVKNKKSSNIQITDL